MDRDKPLVIEKFYRTATKAVHCPITDNLVGIDYCRGCEVFGGLVYRINGTDMDVVCFEEKK